MSSWPLDSGDMGELLARGVGLRLWASASRVRSISPLGRLRVQPPAQLFPLKAMFVLEALDHREALPIDD